LEEGRAPPALDLRLEQTTRRRSSVPKEVVGLDIGTNAVRAVQVRVGSSKPTLVAFGQVALTPGAVVEGEVVDRPLVAAALRRLWKEGRFRQTHVHVALAGLRAITRELEMPEVPKGEIDQAVRFQADELIPFPAEATILSTCVLGRRDGPDGQPLMRVSVAAAHRDMVERIVASITAAGLVPVGVDLASSALVRVMAPSETGDPASRAVVDIGAGITIVAIYSGTRSQFVRTIGLAGSKVTESIAKTLGISVGDAEVLKRRYGSGDPDVEGVDESIGQPITALASEIRSTIDFYSSLPGRQSVDRIALSGAGSALPGLRDRLADDIRVPVVDAEPLRAVEMSRVRLGQEEALRMNRVLAPALGVALPAPKSADAPFNLLPPDLGSRIRDRMIARRVIAAAALVVVILGVVYAARALHGHQVQDQVNDTRKQIAALSSQVAKYNNVVQTRQQVQTAQTRVASAVATEVSWPTVIDQIARNIPGSVKLTSFTGTSTSSGTKAGSPGASASSQSSASTTPSSSGSSSANSHGTTSLPALTATLATVTIQASGPAFGGAASWITQIGSSPAFANVFDTSVTSGTSSAVTFASTLSVTGAAHSTRFVNYEKPAP
jgi:type IV pilus assembly protein PilM